jgi:tetratricopeptide (TPR) repeat protein
LEWILTNKFAPSQFASPAMMRQAAKHLAEGQQLVRSGKRAEAHESFVHATEQDHNNQAAWLWRASTTQDADQALVCIEQALRLNPKNAMAMEARKFLIARIQGDQPKPIAPVGEPVAPTLMPEITSAPNSNVHLLLLAIATVLLILLIYILLRNLQLVP